MRTPGSVEQSLMAVHPAIIEHMEMKYPLRGVVGKVRFKDDPMNKTGQTVLDISLYDGYPAVYNVPVTYPFINKENGDDETPAVGCLVLVQFIAGRFDLPVVTGYLAPPNTAEGVLAKTADAPRSRRTRNGTYEQIGKDGSRILNVAKDDNVTITGSGTITVANGNLTINVTKGNVTLTSKGKTTVKGSGTVEIIGSDGGTPLGVVTGGCMCVYTGKPHPVVSTTVKASS